MTDRQQARWEARQRWTLRPERPADPLSPRVLHRECVTRNSVTDFPYHLLVAGEVNREAWSAFVREDLLPLTKGKKATLARLLGVDPKTIDLWLQGRVRVSEASVRQVAERTQRRAGDLLVRVGVYTLDDLPAVTLTDEQIDEEQRRVLDTDLDDEQKALILAELDAMRTDDERLLEEQRTRDRQRRQQRIAEMIDRARERR